MRPETVLWSLFCILHFLQPSPMTWDRCACMLWWRAKQVTGLFALRARRPNTQCLSPPRDWTLSLLSYTGFLSPTMRQGLFYEWRYRLLLRTSGQSENQSHFSCCLRRWLCHLAFLSGTVAQNWYMVVSKRVPDTPTPPWTEKRRTCFGLKSNASCQIKCVLSPSLPKCTL